MNITNYTPEKYEELSKEVHTEIEDFRSERKASLIGIKVAKDGNREMKLIAEDGDVYELMEKAKRAINKGNDFLNDYQLIALLTAGWAAPVNNDKRDNVAPSEHPERVRVKMTLLGNTAEQYSSSLTFSGKDEIMYDYMNAGGALADEFESFLESWRTNGK